MRRAALLLVLGTTACHARPSREQEKTSRATPAVSSTIEPHPTLVSYPNGGALVADPASCSVTRVHQTARWMRAFAPCDNALDIAVGPDSVAAVRSPAAVVGLSLDGDEVWRVSTPEVPAALRAPAATRDSLVVVALSPQLVVAYRKGREAWRVVLAVADSIVAAPLGNQTEGVLLVSVRGVLAVGADGTARWTASFDGQSKPVPN